MKALLVNQTEYVTVVTSLYPKKKKCQCRHNLIIWNFVISQIITFLFLVADTKGTQYERKGQGVLMSIEFKKKKKKIKIKLFYQSHVM